MRSLFFCILSVALVSTTARAVIVLGPQGRNTTEPTAKQFINSGWQYEGDLGPFSGTAIAPHFFITAQHIGFSPGSSFDFDGTSYTDIAAFSEPGTDLRIVEIDGTFPTFAPLYTGKNERGKQVMIIGRGTQRGDPILVKKNRRGWMWGEEDDVRSWGINTVRATGTFGGTGDLLQIKFNSGASPNEGILSGGDSGGGMFIKDKGVWKLAGVNYSISGPLSTTGVDGSGFFGAVYNEAGLYTGGDGDWTLHHPSGPVAAYSSRVSTNLTWITSVLEGATPPDAGSITSGFTSDVPEPALLPVVLVLIFLSCRRARST